MQLMEERTETRIYLADDLATWVEVGIMKRAEFVAVPVADLDAIISNENRNAMITAMRAQNRQRLRAFFMEHVEYDLAGEAMDLPLRRGRGQNPATGALVDMYLIVTEQAAWPPAPLDPSQPAPDLNPEGGMG